MDISKLPVIPQYLGTCWFNAILMSLLYSDGCQETLYNIAIRDGWYLNKKGESFKFLLFTILNLLVKIKRETEEENLIRLYNELEEIYLQNKPEKIFLKYAYKYDYSIRDTLETGYYNFYIITFLKNLGISVLDIIEKEEKKYIGFMTYINEYDTNYKLNKIQELLSKGIDFLFFIDYNPLIPDSFLLTNFRDIRSISNYELRSIIINNFNNPIHAITGITYEREYYIYNGTFNKNDDNCYLMPYDWNIKTSNFCIDYERCEIVKAFEGNLCFNFNLKSSNRVRIYTSSQIIKPEIKEVVPFRNLSHITSHIEHYYDDLLHSNNKEDIIKKIKEFEKFEELFEDIQEKIKGMSLEEYIAVISKKLEEMNLEELKNLLNRILYTHFYLDRRKAEIIFTLQAALIEANRIKQEAIEKTDNKNKLSILNATLEANKIIEEAIEKAEKEREKIIKEAKKLADTILENASKQAIKQTIPQQKTLFSRIFQSKRNRIVDNIQQII